MNTWMDDESLGLVITEVPAGSTKMEKAVTPRQHYGAVMQRHEDEQRLVRMHRYLDTVLAAIARAPRGHYSTVASGWIADDPQPAAAAPATKSAPSGLVWSTVVGGYIPAADRNAFYVPSRRRTV